MMRNMFRRRYKAPEKERISASQKGKEGASSMDKQRVVTETYGILKKVGHFVVEYGVHKNTIEEEHNKEVKLELMKLEQ